VVYRTHTGIGLVVERPGSLPAGNGAYYENQQPGWIVIRGNGATTNPRHRPIGGIGNAEVVLAARCDIGAKYELTTYPTLQQDRPDSVETDDREEFFKLIREEIARR
jgi:hypothetical protein